jgi:hypothetical protein
MYSLSNKNRDLLVERLVTTDHYQAFLNGTLDDKHYQYSINDLPETSELVTAKTNHQRYALQSLRRALLPLIAEDVGTGRASEKVLYKVAEHE